MISKLSITGSASTYRFLERAAAGSVLTCVTSTLFYQSAFCLARTVSIFCNRHTKVAKNLPEPISLSQPLEFNLPGKNRFATSSGIPT